MKETCKNSEELIEILKNNAKNKKMLKKKDNNPGFQNILIIGEFGVGKTYMVEQALKQIKKDNKKMKKNWINASYFNENEPIDQQILKNLPSFSRLRYWIFNDWGWETVLKTVGYVLTLTFPVLTVTLNIGIGWKWGFVGVELFLLLMLLISSVIKTNINSLRKIIKRYDYVIIDDLNRIENPKQKINIYNFFLCFTEDMNRKEKNLKKMKKKNYKETRLIFIDSYGKKDNEKDGLTQEQKRKYFDLIIEKLLNEDDIVELLKEEKNNVNLWSLLSPISGYKTLLKWIASTNDFRLAIEFKVEIEKFILELEYFIKLFNDDERGYLISMFWGKIQNKKEYGIFLQDVSDISASSKENGNKIVKKIMKGYDNSQNQKTNFRIKYSASHLIFNNPIWKKNTLETIYNTGFFDNLFNLGKNKKQEINNFCSTTNKKIINTDDFNQFNKILNLVDNKLIKSIENITSKLVFKWIPLFEKISIFELSKILEMFKKSKQFNYYGLKLFYYSFLNERIKKLEGDSTDLKEIRKEYEKNIEIISTKFDKTTMSLKEIADNIESFAYLTKILIKNDDSLTIEKEKNLIQESLKTNDAEFIKKIDVLSLNLMLDDLANENQLVFNWLEKNVLTPLELTDFLDLLFKDSFFWDASEIENMICYVSFQTIKDFPNCDAYIEQLIKWSNKKIFKDRILRIRKNEEFNIKSEFNEDFLKIWKERLES